MKLGILTGIWYIANETGLVETLSRVSALGFQYVDLQGIFHAGPIHLDSKERRTVRARMDELQLVPRSYILHSPHNLASATQSELSTAYEYLCEGVDLAHSWGMNQLMLNAGLWAIDIGREQAWSRAVAFIQRVCDYAAKKDIFIAQEYEPYIWFLVNDTASSVRMLEDVNRPNFTLLVDFGHMALARENPEALEALADHIIHAHISDHLPLSHTNQIAGTGFAPTASYLEVLQRIDIDGRMNRFGYNELVVSLELGFPGDRIENPDKWVIESVEHVQKIAPYLTRT